MKFLLFVVAFYVETIIGIEDFSEVSVSKYDNYSKGQNSDILIVSTIDGKVSAFKSTNGQKLWSINTEPGDLFSSSLSQLEVLFRGQPVQVIPSLNGNLYKFDGKTLEQLPVSADMLLSTSYKIGENLNIVGEKKVQSYGINLHTGEMRYICTSQRCEQFSAGDDLEDIIVIERHSQTVRAVNSRSGDDQWSFCVSEHLVSVSKGIDNTIPNLKNMSMNGKFSAEQDKIMPLSTIKIAMLKGFIGIVDQEENLYKWSQKLSSPIVDVWHVVDGNVIMLDLFENAGFSSKNTILQSLLLVGVFNEKLYIKQSNHIKMSKDMESMKPNYNANLSYYIPVFDEKISTQSEGNSLILKYPVPNYENGVFFSKNNPNESNTTHCFMKTVADLVTVKQSVISFIYKWKHACVATILCCIMTNILFILFWRKKRMNSNNISQQVENNESKTSELFEVSPQKLNQLCISPIKVVDIPSSALSVEVSFRSRYLDDFEFIECLGKGGFGVVFKVKNKIDCCDYAVKRIKFAKAHVFDKINREVKVLAKLDHIGIVRYYNAWVETPPVECKDVYGNDSDDESMSSVTYSKVSNTCDDMRHHNACNPCKSEHEISLDINNFSPEAELTTNSFSSGILFENHSSNIAVDNSTKKIVSEDSVRILFDENSDPSCSEKIDQLSFQDSDIVFESNPEIIANISNTEQHKISVKPVKYLFIQMQLCRRETLKDWLYTNRHERNRNEILDIFFQIVSAVEYVHKQGLIHRDLKPSNIFFSLDGVVKIGDFGLVSSEHDAVEETFVNTQNISHTKKGNKLTGDVGTQLYMSPEMIQRSDYTYKIDMFSLGLIFYELLVPFQTQYERIKVLNNIKKRHFPTNFPLMFELEYKLVNKLLMINPENRPSAAEIKEDPLFNAIHHWNLDKQMKPCVLSGTVKFSHTAEDLDTER